MIDFSLVVTLLFTYAILSFVAWGVEEIQTYRIHKQIEKMVAEEQAKAKKPAPKKTTKKAK